jgi:sodium-dependent dicarboxylate transporter 2/3/5
MLVKVRLAKRMALWLILKFGRKASWALMAFVIIQMVLAPLIPATAARAVMTLPLIIVVAAIYGATEEHNNNFGRNLFLLNLVGISVLSSMTMTGSSANLIAVGLIQTMGGERVYYMDWVRVGAPIAIMATMMMWWLGQKLVFPIAPADRVPQLEGGLGLVEQQYAELGPLRHEEKKALAIFGLVLILWMTDALHMGWFGVEISAPFAALLGAVLVLFPRYGVLQWSEAEIPWHLLIFSAGAYAGGLALDDTGAAEWGVRMLFGGMDLKGVPFGVSLHGGHRRDDVQPPADHLQDGSHADPVAHHHHHGQGPGLATDRVCAAAALCIDWVVGLPISGKPNVILFSTNQYSVLDNFKYGVLTCTLGVVLLVVSGATWFHWIGLTPAFWAVAP